MEKEDLSITQQQTEEVARLLKSRKIEEQAKGKRLLDGMGEQGIDILLVLLNEEQRKLKFRKRLYWYLILSCALVTLVINLFEKPDYTRSKFRAMLNIVIVTTLNRLNFRSNLHTQVLKQLEELDDIRILGALIDNLDTKETRKRLLHLLPRLQASDAGLLNAEQRKKLYAQLKWGYRQKGSNSENYECVLTILKALEQIGDAEAIPYVEQLIQRTSNTLIRTAAEECLPFLQNRGHQRQIAETLLRPSQPDTPPDMLLRPAGKTADTEPEQLLRAASERDTM